MAVAPGGTGGKGIALVANLDSNSVTPVDLGTWRAGTPIAVGTEPVAIAVSVAASGAATAFVADYGSNTVTPIDVATHAGRRRHPGRTRPPDHRRRARARCSWATSATAPSRRSTRRRCGPGGTVALPLNPTGIAVAPSGATAYVCGGAARGRGDRRSA